MPVYKFRNCLLNIAERSLVIEGKAVPLTSKTLDVLNCLLEKPGEIRTKDEILGMVWNGDFVEESNLPVQISKLRKYLAETTQDRFIETVQGVGYRFIAPVQQVPEEEWHSTRGVAKSVGEPQFENSIVIVPFSNESEDAHFEYVVDGITEGLINGLSHLPAFRVIARNTAFRYKGKENNFRTIGRLLGVSKTLTGRVRVSGNRIVIGMELTEASTGIQLWGNTYTTSFSRILTVQQSAVREISNTLIHNATAPRAAPASVENPESFRFYLMGSHFLQKRTEATVLRAIQYFEKSLSFSATNTLAHVGMAEGYRFLYVIDCISRHAAIERIEVILRRISAKESPADMIELLLGKVDLYVYWRFDSAEEHLRRALLLNPNSADAGSFLAEILAISGRIREALEYADRVLFLDPISLLGHKRVARICYLTREYDRALALLNDAFEMEPHDFETLALLGAVHVELENYETANVFFRKSFGINPDAETIAMVGYVSALTGQDNEARRVVQRLETEFRHQGRQTLKIGRIYAALGNFDVAHGYLKRALDDHEVDLHALSADPRWRWMGDDPEFKSVLRTIGLPASKHVDARRIADSDENRAN